MKNRALFLLKYAGLWIVFFLIARVLFLLYHFNESSSLSFYELVNIFIRGIWMDLSISGYVMLLVFIIFALFGFSGSIVSQAVRIVTFVLIALSSSIIITDLELYRNWGFRIDAAPLLYLKTPGEAMASVKWWLIVIFVAISFLLFIAFVYAYNKLVHSKC
ncbi:MAG TPA: LTA synthase family protein, partial [Tenuifilaceae bacterium]|nr:LTA synthase family protein [Tenuifilaceae bacterium]